MKKTRLFFIILIVFELNMGFAQSDTAFWNEQLKQISDSTSQKDWIILKENTNFTPYNIFTVNKNIFGLKNADSMKIFSDYLTEAGIRHARYQQYYNGIKVENCIAIVHSINNKANIINGTWVKDIDININPNINENDALTFALNNINAQKYFWEDTATENALKRKTGDPMASYYPHGELIICLKSRQLSYTYENLTLAYKFKISSLIPYDEKIIYIDATNGNLIKQNSLVINCVQGAGTTYYNDYQIINTDQWLDNNHISCKKYRLYDDCRGQGIHTRCYGMPGTGGNCNLACDDEITDGNNYFHFQDLKAGVSAHWAAEKAFDYFLNLGQNSFDNSGLVIDIYVNNDQYGSDNAFWNGDDHTLNFGSGNGGSTNNPMVSLDEVGHEFTHGVTQYIANLDYDDYNDETGALNESFSDIFGTMIEFYAQGGNGDYLCGEDNWITDGYLRNLQNPNAKTETVAVTGCPNNILSYKQPDTYQGNYWLDYNNYPDCDYGGVHINGGVQNFWFYLLSEGGSDINDLSNNYCVSAIGKDKAAKIAFYNLRDYIVPTSSYSTARTGSIQAAIDIYGANSNEVAQVTSAWYAVGVGSKYNGIIEVNNHTVSGTESIQYNNEIVFNSLQVPSGSSLTVTSNSKIIMNTTSKASSGSYFHAYITPGCMGGAKINNSDNNNNYSEYNMDQEEINKTDTNIVTNNKFLLIPNPNNGNMQVVYEIPENTTGTFEVFNMIGKKLFSYSLYSGKNTFPISRSDLNQGIYFYRATAGNKQIAKDKLIVIK